MDNILSMNRQSRLGEVSGTFRVLLDVTFFSEILRKYVEENVKVVFPTNPSNLVAKRQIQKGTKTLLKSK